MPDIELKKIQPNRLNPRLEFTKAGLDELADSIRQVGLLEPIMVRPRADDTYEVVVGERRYRAAHQAGLNTVPVIVRDYTDDEVLELNFIENVQREDLSAVEKGRLCRQLLEQFPNKYPSVYSLGKALGISESHIFEWIKLLDMPEEVQRLIKPQREPFALKGEPKIDYQTAVTIARQVKEPEKQVELAQRLAERHVPQRVARDIIKEISREPEKPVGQVFREVVEEAPVLLPFSRKHADAILDGHKTQTSRKGIDPKIRPGRIVRAAITHFADLEIVDVHRKRLGDFDEEDAQREGGYTLEEFKEVWKGLHGVWNPNESVSVVRFRLAKVVGESSNSG
ncbi:Nucleoid occlusion protein [subsurface metagenome]